MTAAPGIDRRTFLAVVGAGAAALLAACGATPAPQASPSAPVYGPVQTASPAQGPRFAVDRKEIDFGSVKFEKVVSAVFKVTNTGSAALALKTPTSVRAELGCWPSQIVVGQTTLAPNQSTTVRTDFTMHEGMGGQHVFVIDVTTNDPAQPLVSLKVRSNWVP